MSHNVQISTAAVVGWQSLDTQRFLANPDPPKNNLTFRTRFEKTFSSFDIWIPVHLKRIPRRVTRSSPFILSIQLATIETFNFEVLETIPQPVREKLKSQVLRVDFNLNKNITILINRHTQEKPQQGQTHSGNILDNVREISQTTSISVYIDYSASNEAQLNSIRNALDKGHYQYTSDSQLDLQSLFGGQGAKIACLGTNPGQRTKPGQLQTYIDQPLPFEQPPPPFEQPPPPFEQPPPPFEQPSPLFEQPPLIPDIPGQKRKRPQVDHDECEGDTTPLWFKAMLDKLDSMHDKIDSVNHKIDSMHDKIDSMHDKIDSMHDKIDSMHDKIDSMQNLQDQHTVCEEMPDTKIRMRHELQERVAAPEKENETARPEHDLGQEQHSDESMPSLKNRTMKQRVRTMEAEIETLQKRTEKLESNDGRICDIEDDHEELKNQQQELEKGLHKAKKYCKNISDKIVSKDDLEDFRRDIVQDIARRILGDD